MTKIESWTYAARPKTLTGALAPVVVALAMVWSDIHEVVLLPAILCLLFALLMQIDANFINDYYDFKKGRDDSERLGPERACAQGWITPENMWRGIIATSVMACAIGLPLVFWGGWQLVVIGFLCLLGAFLYTTMLAQRAMGDVLVIVFFGLVPVCTTYYIQTGECRLATWLMGVAVGLATECLLLVNNYRDRKNDAMHGKKTLAVIIGKRGTETVYALCGLAAVALTIAANCNLPIIAIYLIFHFATLRNMHHIGHGRELNNVLAQTARNILIFALLTTISILL